VKQLGERSVRAIDRLKSKGLMFALLPCETHTHAHCLQTALMWPFTLVIVNIAIIKLNVRMLHCAIAYCFFEVLCEFCR